MGWLNTLFGSKRNRLADRPGSPAFRPRVERLEDRRLFNVSPVFDAQGHLSRYIVHDDGSLTLFNQTGAHVLAASGVRVAHGFRDRRGRAGVDIVYTNGNAFEIDSFGSHFIGNNILDMSRAYDALGNFRLEVIYNDGSGFTGMLVQSTKSGTTVLGTGVKFATAYLDAAGHFGLAVGKVDASSNLLATTQDSKGTRVLYSGSFVITQAIGDYDQAVDPKGRLYIDLVFNPANSGPGSLGSPHTGLEFGPVGISHWGINIGPN
jgi:hypothetical protein